MPKPLNNSSRFLYADQFPLYETETKLMMLDTAAVLAGLTERLGLRPEWLDHSISITGTDPVVPSRYRPALASAAALAAHAIGVAEIWRQRGGGRQSMAIDLRQAAVPGLRTVSHVKRDGHVIQLQR